MPTGLPRPAAGLVALLRTAIRRFYFFEIWVLAMVAAMHGLFYVKGYGWLGWTLSHTFRSFSWLPMVLSLAALPLVAVWMGVRERNMAGTVAYLRSICTWRWWLLTLRIWLGVVLTMHVYVWLKLYVPYLNSALYDRVLWEIEQRLAMGVSPSILMLELFRSPWALRTIDWSYARVFEVGLYAIMMFFPALRSNAVRVACATSFILIWTVGGWLHVLLPALGPCYWNPAPWKPYAGWLRETVEMQAALFRNYQAMTVLRHVEGLRVHPIFGVAAFPSMHNASHALLACWAFFIDRRIGWMVWASVALIFVGSIVTGWHYVVDSAVGVGMACAAYAGVCRLMVRAPRIPNPE